ncbi:hypothetical protein Pcinc_028250 [Petrolisthes cinctipes]|uniref:Uncharacterized protein n=1 Tax=Petrolisthes cinctipes TaxID=88211 RepID=A0AAE1F3I7_PETCI|nr:hypothetical protein Pcinc_028250 [Petrolisthes cinctipes]
MAASCAYSKSMFLQRLQFWEDTPRRRRRRGPLSPVSSGSGSLSVGASEPLKTPEVVRHVVSRLTPPASPPTYQSAQPSSPPTRSYPSPRPSSPSHTFKPIQPAAPDTTHSAPSTLDNRSRFSRDSESRGSDGRRLSGSLGDRSETEEGNVRKVPPKLAPLRKPEIPDVLRPKDTTGLASPGVVSTPPSSRPSSVVLDKPPLAPEGQRPPTLRSSLRKPNETGTCFMAARREKRDDIKPENIFRELQRPKKGDRLSKSDMNLKVDTGRSGDSLAQGGSDYEASGTPTSPIVSMPGTEEVMSSRLEALTTRARETMERADCLANDSPPPLPESSPPEDSADNMVHECEEYLTVNPSIKETGSVIRPRDISSSDPRTEKTQPLTSMKGVISDTGQKNWLGGSEGRSKESKRVAMEKEIMKRDPSQAAGQDKVTAASAVPSGPPDNGTFISDNVSPPPEEVIHGLSHSGFGDEDLCSPDSTQIRSPDHRSSSGSGSSSKRSSRRCSLEGDTPQIGSPDPQSILKHRSSREDVGVERPTTPEPHSILKRKTSSRTSSIDTIEGEPRPILKKKSSVEELDHFEPRPILKKKSSTDDELDDRPRSILKGGRSREDLDHADGVLSPNPILKRSPRCDSEGEGELRPILKRRDTTDGVRLRLHVSDGEDVDGEAPNVRVRSDSAPEAVIRLRGRSPPASTATPSHGILKKRGAQSPGRFDQMDSELGAILRSRRSGGSEEDTDNEGLNRPVSPSLVALTRREESTQRSGERPLSVAERVAGMEAARQEPPPPLCSPTPTSSPGARPKVMPVFLDRPPTPTDKIRETRRNSAYSLIPDPSPTDGVEAINEALIHPAEAYNNNLSTASPSYDPTTPDAPSLVSQKAAFFAQLEREQKSPPEVSPLNASRSARLAGRRDRGTRHATQPVTDDEVSQAARLADGGVDLALLEPDTAQLRRETSVHRKPSLSVEASTTSTTTTNDKSSTYEKSSGVVAFSEDVSSSVDTNSSVGRNGSVGDNSVRGSVGARVAQWTKMLEQERTPPPPLDGALSVRRRTRSARFKTQPVTLEEVAHAHALNSSQPATDSAITSTQTTPHHQEIASGFRAAREAVMRNAAEVLQGLTLTPTSSPRRRPTSRNASLNDPEDEYASDPVRGE